MKVILVGNSGVGKSSFLHQYVHRKFEYNLGATIGVDFVSKKAEMSDGSILWVNVWDTAGQERYRTITPSYFKRVAAAIFMYDITDRQSFNDIGRWMYDYDTHADVRSAVMVLVGNKSDLDARRVVGWLEGSKLAYENGMLYFESSARDNVTCNSVFDAMISAAAARPDLEPYVDFIEKTSERKRDNGVFRLKDSSKPADYSCINNCSTL